MLFPFLCYAIFARGRISKSARLGNLKSIDRFSLSKEKRIAIHLWRYERRRRRRNGTYLCSHPRIIHNGRGGSGRSGSQGRHPRTCTRLLRDRRSRRGHPRRSRIPCNLRSRSRNLPRRRNSHDPRTRACRDTGRSSRRIPGNRCP